MKDIIVKTQTQEELSRLLVMHDIEVKELENDVLVATREGELPVFIKKGEKEIYFEVDLGNISGIASEELYFKLLDMNTEVLPVSFGINNTNPEDPRLVLVESRETVDLCTEEVLSVFDALELATDRAEQVLGEALQS
ncbi:hypothetical protein [Coraliomargarita parva]|uniref:hypothetical protein n=1 Tax=Coraliomargarita parva TaxID=3014050 RepID=UPI0022B38CA2|nr:hypothetical protein [Coraliomargarita parva]